MSSVISLVWLLTYAVATVHTQHKPDGEWSYDPRARYGPEHWEELNPKCAGKQQSPIHIHRWDVTLNPDMPALNFDGYDGKIPHDTVFIQNNGHSFNLDFSKIPEENKMMLSGALLKSRYKLWGVHFHWGANKDQGMEHAISKAHHPIETHMVHVKEGLDIGEALKHDDGLVVVAVFFDVGDRDHVANPELHKITDHLYNVRYFGLKDPVNETLSVSDLLPPDTSNFFFYHGSLTTPPCNEAVNWIIMVDTVRISEKQLDGFRHFHWIAEQKSNGTDADGLVPQNDRPLQELHGRKIFVRKPIDWAMLGEGGGAGGQCVSVVLFLFTLFTLFI